MLGNNSLVQQWTLISYKNKQYRLVYVLSAVSIVKKKASLISECGAVECVILVEWYSLSIHSGMFLLKLLHKLSVWVGWLMPPRPALAHEWACAPGLLYSCHFCLKELSAHPESVLIFFGLELGCQGAWEERGRKKKWEIERDRKRNRERQKEKKIRNGEREKEIWTMLEISACHGSLHS